VFARRRSTDAQRRLFELLFEVRLEFLDDGRLVFR
jgi:hypothetical protein